MDQKELISALHSVRVEISSITAEGQIKKSDPSEGSQERFPGREKVDHLKVYGETDKKYI